MSSDSPDAAPTPTPTPTKKKRHWLVRLLLLLVGFGLLAAFIMAAGPEEIAANLRRMGWGWFWLVAIATVWRTLAATAMWLIVPPEHGVSWWRVTAIRWAGESVNMLMPFGNVSGEPLKAVMLAREMGGAESTGVVLLDKTIFFLASMGFMITGVVMGATVLSDHPGVYALSIALLVPWIALLGWIVRRQMKGDFVVQVSRVLKVFRRELSPKIRQKLERVDAALGTFWRERRGRFALAFGIHVFARFLRIADVWIAVHLLGVSISVLASYLTAAVGMLVSTSFFFIPGALGAAEGGQGFVLELVGPGVAVGVSVALARRVRNYFIAALSYGIVLAWPSGPKPGAALEGSESAEATGED